MCVTLYRVLNGLEGLLYRCGIVRPGRDEPIASTLCLVAGIERATRGARPGQKTDKSMESMGAHSSTLTVHPCLGCESCPPVGVESSDGNWRSGTVGSSATGVPPARSINDDTT